MLEGVTTVIGPPGCGKTTRISEIVKDEVEHNSTAFGNRLKDPVVVCSLTRAAAAEASGRDMPIRRNCVGTLHSHAHRALDCPEIAESHAHEFTVEHPTYPMKGEARADVDDPHYETDTSKRGLGDNLLEQMGLLRARKVTRELWPMRVREFASKWEEWKKANSFLDFTDLISSCIDDDHGEHLLQPRHIMIDEAQDFSALELDLLRVWSRGAEALTLVGDPFQALYVWRGAHPQMFAEEEISERGVDRVVLEQSYRVPRRAHALAVEWIRQLSTWEEIAYRPTPEGGEVSTLAASFVQSKRIIETIKAELDEGRSVMIQTTCSYFLPKIVQALRAEAIPFSNPWRRKRGDWNPLGGHGVTMARRVADLIAPMITRGDSDRLWTFGELWNWIKPLTGRGFLQHGAKAKAEGYAQQFRDSEAPFNEILNILGGEMSAEIWSRSFDRDDADPSALIEWWRSHLMVKHQRTAEYATRVADAHGTDALTTEPRVFVGTIHSFKGAEADTTIIVPDLSPSGAKEWRNTQSGGRDSVVRQGYVAITRARKKVLVCRARSSMSMPIAKFIHSTQGVMS